MINIAKLIEVADAEKALAEAKSGLNPAELRVMEKAVGKEIFGKGSGRGETRKKMALFHAKQANAHALKAHKYHTKHEALEKSGADMDHPNNQMYGVLAQHHAKLAKSHNFVHRSLTGKEGYKRNLIPDQGASLQNYMEHIGKRGFVPLHNLL